MSKKKMKMIKKLNARTIGIIARKSIPYIAILVFSLVIAFFLSLWKDDAMRSLMQEYLNEMQEGMKEQHYAPSDVDAEDYDVAGRKYVARSDDPKLVISGVNQHVNTITIFFEAGVVQDTPVEVFWSIEGEGFVPERMVTAMAQKGTSQLSIDLDNQVVDLRLDIGTSKGVSFALDHIEVNHKIGFAEIFDCMLVSMKKSIWFDRFQIIFLIACFVLVHFIVDIKKMYQFLFDKRWIVAGILLLFLCINEYHGNSITAFDMYVQPGAGNDYIQPVLGKTRDIRSDEWVVGLPNSLSYRYLDDSSNNNYILRGTNTAMGRTTVISIVNPINLVGSLASLLGDDCSYSYFWYVPIFLTFLFNLELFYIISSRRRLLSACGACMVALSSHYLWWAFPVQVLYAPASLVCAYYFFNNTSWKKRLLFGYGTACAVTLFVINLYPAWQVPMGYVSIAILVWIIHESWDRIKGMKIRDWGIFAAALVLCILMVIDNLMAQREYIASITQTVYPGGRIDYGGFSLPKLFNYVGALLFPYVPYLNPSESGMYLSFFPLPLIIAGYLWWKQKKKDWLITGILLVSAFLVIYTTVGLPEIVARLTMMTSTTSTRCVDILGYAMVILFVAAMSRYDMEIRMQKKYAYVIAGVASCAAVYFANLYMPDYMGVGYLLLSSYVLFFVFASCLAKVGKKIYHYALIAIILIAVVNGVYVRPIVKGMDAIYSKPLAKEIEKVASGDKKAKWIAYGGGIVLPALTVACGAPTINNVNTYPNMDLWKKLDPEGKYDYAYNRYAHVLVAFVEGATSMELVQEDTFQLNLCYQDLQKAEVEYIASTVPLDVDNEFVRFDKMYDEQGGYIYKIYYKK